MIDLDALAAAHATGQLVLAGAGHWWSGLQDTVFSAEVVRPLIVATTLGGWAAFRRLLRDRKVQARYREHIAQQLEAVMAELKTNHGSSLRDAINEIRQDVRSVAAEVGHQGDRLDRHLDFADHQVERLDRLAERGPESHSPGTDAQ